LFISTAAAGGDGSEVRWPVVEERRGKKRRRED
jgi:hypothetical protein